MWICWYLTSFSDIVNVTISGTNYNDTATNLAAAHPGLFETGTSPDGKSIGLMANVPGGTITPLSATVNTVPQLSTDCEFVGGQPKPPNR